MKFEEALALMRTGVKIARPGWLKHRYIYWNKDCIKYGGADRLPSYVPVEDIANCWLKVDDFEVWKEPTLKFKDLQRGDKFKTDNVSTNPNIYMKLSKFEPDACVSLKPAGHLYRNQHPDMVVYKVE